MATRVPDQHKDDHVDRHGLDADGSVVQYGVMTPNGDTLPVVSGDRDVAARSLGWIHGGRLVERTVTYGGCNGVDARAAEARRSHQSWAGQDGDGLEDYRQHRVGVGSAGGAGDRRRHGVGEAGPGMAGGPDVADLAGRKMAPGEPSRR